MTVRLESIDQKANKFRFYQVAIEPNLFGDQSVVVRWGRIGAPSSVRVHASGDATLVGLKAKILVRKKVKKGYAKISG